MGRHRGDHVIPGVLAGAGLDPSPDPQFSNVVLLCGFNGADGATAFVSEDSAHKTATFVSGAQLDTAEKKFGSASLLVDGSSHIHFPDSTDYFFSTGDFTVEAWVRFNSTATKLAAIFSQNSAWAFYAGAGFFNFYWSAFDHWENAATLATGIWYHVACCRNGNNLRFFLQGVQQGATRDMTGVVVSNQATTLNVGLGGAGQNFNGWIDEARITKGFARYTGDFTPPIRRFPRS